MLFEIDKNIIVSAFLDEMTLDFLFLMSNKQKKEDIKNNIKAMG